jgi:hypothetical protein
MNLTVEFLAVKDEYDSSLIERVERHAVVPLQFRQVLGRDVDFWRESSTIQDGQRVEQKLYLRTHACFANGWVMHIPDPSVALPPPDCSM